jgi:hypothetical protein
MDWRQLFLELGSNAPSLKGISCSSKLGGLDHGIGMEPALHHVIAKQIENGEQRHALVMRHPFANENGLAG